ncbi:hypothetical protein DPX16_13677, partial [Anabarilius grahami]
GKKSAGNTHASQSTCARPFYSCPCLPRYPLEIKTHPTTLESRAGGDRLCRPATGSRWLARCRVAFDLGPRGRLNIIGVLRRFHLSAAPWSRCFALTAYALALGGKGLHIRSQEAPPGSSVSLNPENSHAGEIAGPSESLLLEISKSGIGDLEDREAKSAGSLHAGQPKSLAESPWFSAGGSEMSSMADPKGKGGGNGLIQIKMNKRMEE